MPISNIQPVSGYLLVEPLKQEKTTASGIVLPESHEEKPQSGKVIAVGASIFDDGHEVTCPVKVGDVIVYKEWGGKEYKDGQTNLLILKFEDVMAVIK
ncbi:co-chaperone GroES [Patescibacteria group bacterium]|nr:co-chaperone GroES [Patescibacteria group bacterium]